MTAGAAFLNWMKPDHLTGTSPGIELIARGPAERVWKSIEVEVCMPGHHPLPQSHFLVYDNGACQQTEHWRDQKPLGPGATVHIALVAANGPEPITKDQRSTAVALARQLCEQYGIPGGVAIP